MKIGDTIELDWHDTGRYLVRVDAINASGITGPYRSRGGDGKSTYLALQASYQFTWGGIQRISPSKETVEPPRVEVALHPIAGDQRLAVIDKLTKQVYVGCHTFPFSDIEAIAKTISSS